MRTSIMWKSNRKNRKTLSSNQIVQIPSSLLSVPSLSPSNPTSRSNNLQINTSQTTTSPSPPNHQSCLVRFSYPISSNHNPKLIFTSRQRQPAKDRQGCRRPREQRHGHGRQARRRRQGSHQPDPRRQQPEVKGRGCRPE